MSSFSKNWTKTDTRSAGEKLKDTLKPQGPLKPRIGQAMNRLQVQLQKMDSMLTRMQQKDAQLFKRIVESMQAHDVEQGKILAGELAEVRKVSKIMNHARLALEQVHLRLSTVHDLGDAVVALTPAVSVMKDVKQGISKVMPEAENEISEMSSTLSNLLVDTVNGGSFNFVNDASGEEVEKILSEAAAVAEGNVTNRLPSVPGAEELPRFT